jgi:hypothetical protein
MGGFYNSVHVRTEEYDMVKTILEDMARKQGHKFYLAPAINGWVSFFPEMHGDPDIALRFAERVEFDVLQLMVHDDDIFYYAYFRGGELIDEYDSCPDYFGEPITPEDRKRLAGHPEAFGDLVSDAAKIKDIHEILRVKPRIGDAVFPDKAAKQMSKLESLSKAIDEFVQDPEATVKFLSDHPNLLDEETKSLAKEASQQGRKSFQELQQLLEDSGKLPDFARKIVGEFVKSLSEKEEYGFLKPGSKQQKELGSEMDELIGDKCFVDEQGNVQLPEGLFASESMERFGEVLGIVNAVTSYEYLAVGETDGIVGWDRFITIT